MHPRLAKLYIDTVQRARGWDYRPALRELESLQWASPEEVHNRRSRKLRNLLEHCAHNVPFYEEEFVRLGLRPEDVKDRDDLARLSLVTKDRMREDYSRFFATAGERPWDTWPSSGSTGQPFPFRVDRAAIAANTFAALSRARRWWDCDYGVPEGMIWSGVRDSSGQMRGRIQALKRRMTWRMKNITLVDTYVLDEAAIRQGFESLRRAQPVVVRAISSGLYRFCAGLRELGLDGHAIGLRCAIYTGEALPAAQRALVAEVLGCPTVCEYGCTELGILAFECPDGGLHLHNEDHVIELLRDGQPAGPGEEAQLVVTNLNSYSAPLVRYVVGDLVVASDASCACGRTLPLIESVAGRAHDQIHDGMGGVVHGLVFTHIFDELPSVHQFRVVQERIDLVRLELRSTETISAHDKEQVAKAVRAVMHEGTTVEVEQVGGFPLGPNGKFRWIESKVELEA